MEQSLEEQLVCRLAEKHWHISCAESCTGGMLAARIVNVASASRVLNVSFVTYAAEAKTKYVHVSPNIIEEYGVVSEPVVAEMAKGVALESGAEVGIGISGIAGPGGGTAQTPVGTVCFGFSVNGCVTTSTVHFSGLDRNDVRENCVTYALETLLRLI